ncbi:unnamed protein product [Blepharisma stoltei]|uniref:Uncharacterized protein n=1 Tax=Blepharisma stoltei TaxID=1481888 RepID=A0AAU9KDV4_9CILI|nr:unnamed protein product [Blepharisma stoltei]
MIKPSYPKLISKKSTNSTPVKPSTAGSINRRKSLSHDYDYKSEYSYNLNEVFEITQTPDARPFSVNVIKYKRNSNAFCDNELDHYDKDLDEFEIGLENTYQSSFLKINGEWEKYQKYLENISICAIQKDSKLGNCIIRGIIGLTKTFKKLSKNINEGPLEAKSTNYKEKSSQTEKEKVPEPRFCSSPELESLKELQSKLKNIRFSRITGQLCDLYDSLCQMHTDIPSPTDTPDLIKFDSEEAAKELEKDVEELRNELTIKLVKKKVIKKTLDKECQVERIQKNTHREELLENILGEKELDLFKLKHKCEELLEERKKWQDKLEEHKNKSNEDENASQNEQEIEKLKEKIHELEYELRGQNINVDILKEKYERARSNFERIKKENGKLKEKLIGKRRKLQEIRENLFQTNVLWRIAEEKTKQIEYAWKVKYGSDFVYGEIDTNEIIKRYNLTKDQESDSEIKEEIGFEGALVGYDGKEIIMSFKDKDSGKATIQNYSNNLPDKEYYTENAGIVLQNNKEKIIIPPNKTENEYELKDSKVAKEEFSNSQKQNINRISQAKNISEIYSKNNWFQASGNTKDEKAQYNYGDTNNSFTNSLHTAKIDELAELAKIAAKKLILTLNQDQTKLFEDYKQIMEMRLSEYQKISKARPSHNKSASSGPPKLSHRSFQYSRLQKKNKKPRPSPIGDSMFSSMGTSLIHTSKVAENAKTFFYTENLKTEGNEEIPSLLISLFKGDEDYWSLSPTTRRLLGRCMEGHDSQFCGEDCEHLKRAMKIKTKYQGVLYPIKKKNVDTKLKNILIYKKK